MTSFIRLLFKQARQQQVRRQVIFTIHSENCEMAKASEKLKLLYKDFLDSGAVFEHRGKQSFYGFNFC
jgi:uncharacterized coiled-coil protein SlyX